MLNKKLLSKKNKRVKMMYSHPSNIIIRTGDGLVFIDEKHRAHQITEKEAQKKLQELRSEKAFSS
jgi:hypothetical protein